MAGSKSDALLGLGANEGDKHGSLDRAIELLDAAEGVKLVAKSDYYVTAPIGGPPGQDAFLNAALRVETTLPPERLLSQLLEIERALGRRRGVRWEPRPLDLDLLLYDALTLAPDPASEYLLELPHPRMEFRRFVLEPAAEVAGDMQHPPTGWTIDRLWRHLKEAPNVAALAGGSTEARGKLASRLRVAVGGQRESWTILDHWTSDREAADRGAIPKLLIALAPSHAHDELQNLRDRRAGPIACVTPFNTDAAFDDAVAALEAMSPFGKE